MAKYGMKIVENKYSHINEHEINQLNVWLEKQNIEVIKTKFVKKKDSNLFSQIFIFYKKVGRKEKLEELNNKAK
jgi:hypothetical protein